MKIQRPTINPQSQTHTPKKKSVNFSESCPEVPFHLGFHGTIHPRAHISPSNRPPNNGSDQKPHWENKSLAKSAHTGADPQPDPQKNNYSHPVENFLTTFSDLLLPTIIPPPPPNLGPPPPNYPQNTLFFRSPPYISPRSIQIGPMLRGATLTATNRFFFSRAFSFAWTGTRSSVFLLLRHCSHLKQPLTPVLLQEQPSNCTHSNTYSISFPRKNLVCRFLQLTPVVDLPPNWLSRPLPRY